MHLDNLSTRLRDRGHFAMAAEARQLEDEVARLAKALMDERASAAQHDIKLVQDRERYSELLANREKTITDLQDRLTRIRALC